MGPHWELTEDRKKVRVAFPTDPPVGLELDAASVDELLQSLGDYRALMEPPHPEGMPLGQQVMAVPAPAFSTEPDALQTGSVLHLRDPRFSWLHYLLPAGEAEKLGNWLLPQVALARRSQAPGKLS